MKKSISFVFKTIILFLLPFTISAQTVNTTTDILWPFDLGTAGQVATYTAGTEGYFSQDYVSNGSNLLFKDFRASTIDGNTYTRFQPLVQSTSPTGIDLISFNIKPKSGLNFTPTAVSFSCMRYGTDGGKIDASWKSSDGTITALQTGISPNRDNNVAGGSIVTIDLSTLNIPASNGDCSLQIYIYTLGNTKQAGLADVKVTGKIEGTLANVSTYSLTTSASPAGAGTIANVPGGNQFDEGTDVTLTATRNFGYVFLHWANDADVVLSTQNPFTLKMTANTIVKAVFTAMNTYELQLNIQGGAKDYMISVTPAPTIVNAKKMFEEGTNVTLTAGNNQVMTFTNWLSGETNPTLNIPMTQNQNITAVYSAVDYIVGWDLYRAGGSSRPADFSSTTDNESSTLVLRKTDGTVNSWLDKSMMAASGYYGRGAAVNWKPLADQYYYQIGFIATDFTGIKVSAGLLYNYNAYSIQKCEYSIDGTNFTLLGTDTLAAGQTWYDKTFTLPTDANHTAMVNVRWIPDYNSSLVGTTATANDGTSISNIFVTANASTYNDGVAPVLSSSVPAASSTGASTTGKVVLNFDEKVQITSGTTATLGSKNLTATVSGKTITFAYTGLDYNTQYTFTLATNTVSDLGGNTLTSPVTFSFTTMNRPVVTKKAFDFVVGVDGDFKAALDAATAASSSGDRFRIFFPNGAYNIGAVTGDTNQKTAITLPNISFIGQSADSVILYNQNTVEGIGVTATIYFSNTANNLYLQDLTLKNKDYRSGTSSLGRCVALQDQGTKNIYKNVNVLSNQDTYYSGSGRLYFEGGSLHGTVDFLCGGGDVFFNECLLYLEDRSGNCITAPATSSSWGYVFSGCTIDGFPSTNGNFNLGRPWQNSPKSIYINTTMKVLPSAAGWTEMGVVPGLFAEYNSMTASGTAVDVSMRKKSFTYSGVTTPVNPYLTAEQAATYTLENVLSGTDAWQPKLYTDQAGIPTISESGNILNWSDNNYVLCWAVFKDGVFVKFVTTNSYTIPSTVTSGSYTVRAANEMGGLSAGSNAILFSNTGLYNPVSNSKLIDQTYFTIDGKKVHTLEGFTGVVIVRSIYADGRVITSKLLKTDF